MMRFLAPIILVIVSISIFFVVTNPMFNDIAVLKTQMASYNEALDNSKKLESEKDTLTQKYNTINPDNLIKIQKLLPDNVDNVRLILEIGQIAAPYGMTLKNVKYNTVSTTTNNATVLQGDQAATSDSKDYGIFNLEFSISGTYDNFINFTKDLESNLRIVDISSISFSSSSGLNSSVSTKTNLAEVYDYSFKISTYWLKN